MTDPIVDDNVYKMPLHGGYLHSFYGNCQCSAAVSEDARCYGDCSARLTVDGKIHSYRWFNGGFKTVCSIRYNPLCVCS